MSILGRIKNMRRLKVRPIRHWRIALPITLFHAAVSVCAWCWIVGPTAREFQKQEEECQEAQDSGARRRELGQTLSDLTTRIAMTRSEICSEGSIVRSAPAIYSMIQEAIGKTGMLMSGFESLEGEREYSFKVRGTFGNAVMVLSVIGIQLRSLHVEEFSARRTEELGKEIELEFRVKTSSYTNAPSLSCYGTVE